MKKNTRKNTRSTSFRIGVDIEKIDRFNGLKEKRHFLKKVYTDYELKHCLPKKNYAQHLAVRFAGKEAVIKASGHKSPFYNEIEIRNDGRGVPKIYIRDKESAMKVSLSHCEDYAVAFVMGRS